MTDSTNLTIDPPAADITKGPPLPPEFRHLLRTGRLNQEQLDKIETWRLEHRCSFAEAALALGHITEADLAGALAAEFRYPIIHQGSLLETAGREVVVAHDPFGPAAEAIRDLRSALIHKWMGLGLRSIALVGAERRTGCTYVAANLSLAMAQAGFSTCLVEANLRHPRLAEVYNLPGRRIGVADVLAGQASLGDAVYKVLHNLTVIPAGTKPPNPQELLSGREFTALMATLEREFEAVIVDTPAGMESADALVVGARARACLLVVRQHRTAYGDVQHLSRKLQETGCVMVGSLLNRF
ncbi:MAG TPA: polysaccharide biosynthesis tyrosine autokinase [Azospirillaceae bacterium]|nr:polysaccharide biosynthesis tyrosine autokinase [Azospirillaceae bacterium]